jgi:hypothetical protein
METDMLKEIQEIRDAISMEATAPDTVQQAAARLPVLLDKASEYLSKALTQLLGDFAGIKNISWMALNAQRRPYSELRSLRIVAPEGFQGTFVEYGEFLIKTVETMEDLAQDVLEPFASWISQRIDDPDTLKSLTNTLKIPGLRTPKVESLQKSLDAFFPDGYAPNSYVYGQLFKRQSDWLEINDYVKKLNTLYANGKYEKVQKQLPDLTQLLTVLGARISEKKDVETFQVSSITLEQLSKVTFEIAELVEFFGVLRHRVDEYLQVVEANVELVKKLYQ